MSWMGGMFQMIGDSIQNNKNLTSTILTNQASRKQFKRDRALAFEREDTAISRRVADARAAGVHPLFALGAANLGGSPIIGTAPEAPRFSGDTGAALASMAPDRLGRETHAAAIAESRARTKLMEAQSNEIVSQSLRASIGARAQQNANSQQDIIKLVPDTMASAQSVDPSVSAGQDHPAYREYTVTAGGLKMDLPYSEEGPSESLENVPFYLWPVIIQHNRAKYGDDWGTRFFREFMLGKPHLKGNSGGGW